MKTVPVLCACLLVGIAARSQPNPPSPIPLTPEQQVLKEKAERAERAEYIKANYTKNEHLIPMRDGVRLFTAVYAPKNKTEQYPLLMMRTPFFIFAIEAALTR